MANDQVNRLMAMMRIIEGRNEDAEAESNYLCRLPIEIITRILLKLDGKDRLNVAKINQRLNGIDQRAGHRNLGSVEFASCPYTDPTISSWEHEGELRKFHFNLSDDDTTYAQFFNQSTTWTLTINGTIDEEVERKLRVAFKTLDFNFLNVALTNACSERLISDLVRRRKSIKEVSINWRNPEDKMENAKGVLMDLPQMEKCTIKTAFGDHRPIDDEAFLHLVSKCDYTTVNCTTNVTASGLERAFKVVYRSKQSKSVACFILGGLIPQLINQLDPSTFDVKEAFIMHRETGCFLHFGLCYPKNYVLISKLPSSRP